MPKTIAIGAQDFADLREKQCFYIDKTSFIKEWWESKDPVTLITRPRRFGKTLNMSMLECFFSNRFAGRSSLFEGLSIWQEETYRRLQGTYPVISLSLADVKGFHYNMCRDQICEELYLALKKHDYLLESKSLTEEDKRLFEETKKTMHYGRDEKLITGSLKLLSRLLYLHTGKKVLIFLDEYDTPMQESYVSGFWQELVALVRNLFNATFKTNPYFERAIMTGITRISKQSIFSDLNNLEVISTTSKSYATAFGFTEKEVFSAMDEFGLGTDEWKEEVKHWYDGFVFGTETDIYNPWSVVNFLKKQEFEPYWANTSSNSLISTQLQQADNDIKHQFEGLLKGETFTTEINEDVVFDQLDNRSDAIWSLMLAGGYLKIVNTVLPQRKLGVRRKQYTLAITNLEVQLMFEDLIHAWFGMVSVEYNGFVSNLLAKNVRDMNRYMNRVALKTFSYFDTGVRPSGAEPERFYHGFVLGLLVDLSDRYEVSSNRESGYGRYDVMLIPKKNGDDAFILEFKVMDPYNAEKSLEDTVKAALAQIEEKKYETELVNRGVPTERIHKYGFAFEGKTVLIEGQ